MISHSSIQFPISRSHTMKSLTTRLLGLAIIAAVSLTLAARHAGAVTIASYPFTGGAAASTDTELNSTADDFAKNPVSDLIVIFLLLVLLGGPPATNGRI